MNAKQFFDKHVGGRKRAFSCCRGSIANGMYIPNTDPNSVDDEDYTVVQIHTMDEYILSPDFKTKDIIHEEYGRIIDIVCYDFRKFMSLLSAGNPNVLMVLGLRPEYILEAGILPEILEMKDCFLGQHVRRTFIGYALGQKERMLRGQFNGHMGEKRRALRDRYGYDPKGAAHAVRLLRMGIELLSGGVVNTYREDAEDLLRIKRGVWSLEHILSEIERLVVIADAIESPLPKGPDLEAINNFTLDVIHRELWK